VLTFPELCHGCGGCAMLCPEKAIIEVPREIGVVEEGDSDGIAFVHGLLKVGEAMSAPLIRAVKARASADGVTIFDAPPGTSCPVIESVKDSDFVILVTEPTPFGLNDLKLAVEMVRKLGLPSGVVINRSDVGDDGVVRYCEEEGIAILLEIPDDRRIAEGYSRGEMAVDIVPELRISLRAMYDSLPHNENARHNGSFQSEGFRAVCPKTRTEDR
jgi:MinD superfamily P-loop ATPase